LAKISPGKKKKFCDAVHPTAPKDKGERKKLSAGGATGKTEQVQRQGKKRHPAAED